MQWFVKILAALFALGLVACGHDDTFHVKGELDDGASINLRFIYYANGGVASGITASNNGKFIFEGRSASPALVEVYDNDYRLMGRFVARNGEDIDLVINRKNPYLTKASGNELTLRLSAFFNANAESLVSRSEAGRNAAVAEYVKAHADDPVSDILLATEFDATGCELLADSLYSLIQPDARFNGISAPMAEQLSRVAAARRTLSPIPYRVTGNRREMYEPKRRGIAMLVFSDRRSGRDSVLTALRRLAHHRSKDRFEVFDLSMDGDTTMWRNTVIADSATWRQGWVPGAVMGRGVEELGIPTLPYFILADSTGRQLWRGSSTTAAVSETVKYLTD